MTLGNSTDEKWSPEPRSPPLDAVNTIIACLAVLGNGMVITVMTVRRRVFSSFTNRLILHQSVIDFIAGFIFFFYMVVRSPSVVVSVEGSFTDELTCRVVASDFLLWWVSVASTYNIVIISLERFMASCYPVKHRNTWTVAKLKLAVITAWGIGFVDNMPLPFIYEPYQGHCRQIDIGFGWFILISSLTIGTEYVVPFIVLIYAYGRILILLRKKQKTSENDHQNVISRAKRNVLITTLLISIMFLVCWTPIALLYFSEAIFQASNWNGTLYTSLVAVEACNMFVNPIIYCFKYEHFRSQLKDLVQKRLRRNQIHTLRPVQVNHR